jgi:hypothetical protein
MTITYNYANAKENFAFVLEKALNEGKVKVRKNNQLFVITPESNHISPLDIEGIDVKMTSEEIIQFIHESRKN